MSIRSAALCAAMIIATAPSLCQAAVDSFYVGVALGATRESSDYAQQVVRGRTADPAPPTDIRLDTDNRPAGRLFAGMRLTPNIALEADYADLGRLSSHAMWHGVDPFFQFERFGRIKVRAAALSVLGSLPITDRMNVFARAGAAYTWVDYETTGTAFLRTPAGGAISFPSPTPPDRTGNGTRGVLALGIDHRLAGRWSVRAEWSRYFNLGGDYSLLQERGKFDLDVAAVGLAYRF